MLYLVHFAEPYEHARHYLGFVDHVGRDAEKALASRLDFHRKGQGSRLLAVVTAAGIEWEVVRTWPDGDRTTERRLKGHSSTRMCPVCNPEGAHRHGVRPPRRSPQVLS